MTLAAIEKRPEQQVGRYAIFDEIAAGGMATVHLARLVGSGGFSRVVAAKRMHRHFLQDPDFRRMFLVEAQLAARILHPNVVPIVDVLSHDDELIIVMEYIHGESLLALMRAAHKAKQAVSVPIGCAVVAALLEGLHAAHEAQNEKGEPLGIVHRDVSPQNVLVGADGVARVLDFGIAKAVHEQNQTNPGTLKGKFSYMAPEVVRGSPITRQADVFSAGVVLWEALAGKMLFGGASEHERLMRIVGGKYPSPRQYNPRVSQALERVVAKALQVDTDSRFATALEFAVEVERVVPIASRRVVSEWVRRLAAATLDKREELIHAIETSNVVQPGQLGAPPPRTAGTPPPIPFEKTNPYAPADAGLRPSDANTSNARRAALIYEIETLPAPPPSAPPSPQSHVADDGTNSGFSTGADSYASIEVDRSPGSAVATAPAVRRRLLARAAAVAAVAGMVALTFILSSSRHSPASVHGVVPYRAPTAAPISARVTGLPLAAPEPIPPNAETAPASGEAPSPALNEIPAKEQPLPRRAVLSPRSPTRATSHAKHYLPSKL
jgi:serine/threonine-protein kinase